MKKVTRFLTMLLAIVMIFTGCATTVTTTKINSDGSAKMSLIMDIDKGQFDSMYKNLGYTNPEDILKDLVSEESAEMPAAQYTVIKKDDGKEYYHVQQEESVSAGKLSETLTMSLGTGDSDFYATKDTVYGQVNLTDEELSGMASGMSSYDPNSVVTVSYVFEFPAAVVNTTGVIDKENPNKVTFSVKYGRKTTVFATTDKAQTIDKVKAKIKKLNTVKKPKIKSLKVKKVNKKRSSVVLKLKKMKGVRYEITYSTNKKVPEYASIYKTTKKTTVTIKGLKAGKKYYFKVKAYKTNFAGNPVYSKAAKKNIKIVKKAKKK